MVSATCLVEKAGLDSRVVSGRSIPNILRWRRRFYIVLAVNPQALHHLKGMLLIFVPVRVRGFEERS